MKILIADSFPAEHVDELIGKGHKVEYRPDIRTTDLAREIGTSDILVVRSTEITESDLESASDLSLVIRAGAGTNTIDTQAAANRGIFVANVPGRNAIAVAELTMGLILAVDRRIPDNVSELRAGVWNKKDFSEAKGLHGRNLGIVGLGSIGLLVAARAAAFGLQVHGLVKKRSAAIAERVAELDIELHDNLMQLAGAVEIISFHLPASPDTEHIINEQLLNALKPGTTLINTSRSDLVDEAALLTALNEKDLWAGFDVYEDEPRSGEEIHSALAKHPRFYGTHHIGASTTQAQEAVAAGVVQIIDEYVAGNIINTVNLELQVLGTKTLSIRHLNRVGVLAAVLSIVRDAGHNVRQMTNHIFQGAEAAIAILQIEGEITPETIAQLENTETVIHVLIST